MSIINLKDVRHDEDKIGAETRALHGGWCRCLTTVGLPIHFEEVYQRTIVCSAANR